ncbi:ABC transporter permease [Patescibacteria group bacterium]|nr:ABC transporter permease [Patescibacteria group bacterium]
MKEILIIWKKELKDTLRDRRTLIAMIVMPMLLMPLLTVGMTKLMEQQYRNAEKETVQIAVLSDGVDQNLTALLEQNNLKIIEVGGDITEAINNDLVSAALYFPTDLKESLNRQEKVEVKIMRKSTDLQSSSALNRITSSINIYNNLVINQRFDKEGINPKILTGLTIVTEDISTQQEREGFGLGFILPMFIVMWSIIGGQYTAIDASAGEKERKTLEALLLTPVSRLKLVIGKFLSVATAGLTTIVISITSLYITIRYFGFGSFDQIGAEAAKTAETTISLTLPPQALLLLLLISSLLVLTFSAVLLSLGIFARSFKEAQSYISPAYLVVILPVVFVNSLPGFKPTLWFFCLPAVNAVLLFKEILVGTYDLGHIVVTIVSLTIYMVITLFITGKIYSKETILFKG